jgi:hypothetical protein
MLKKFRHNNKGQMMVLEAVVFAITVIISLIFLYQMSPTTTQSVQQTSELKIRGDIALETLYKQEVEHLTDSSLHPREFPKNKLVYYLITNETHNLVSDIRSMLPGNVKFNVYVSNGTDKIFLTSSFFSDKPVILADPIAVSHYFISIHPQFFNATKFGGDGGIVPAGGCLMAKRLGVYEEPYTGDIRRGYEISTYDIILEMNI